jgi:hypothetical protein
MPNPTQTLARRIKQILDLCSNYGCWRQRPFFIDTGGECIHCHLKRAIDNLQTSLEEDLRRLSKPPTPRPNIPARIGLAPEHQAALQAKLNTAFNAQQAKLGPLATGLVSADWNMGDPFGPFRAQLNALQAADRAEEVGACILTDENMHTADDCTTHDHEELQPEHLFFDHIREVIAALRPLWCEQEAPKNMNKGQEWLNRLPELREWLQRLDRWGGVVEICESECVKIRTKTTCYTIVAHKKTGRGYLGCVATALEPREGETWRRGNDLADGDYSVETWTKILSDIVAYELRA